MKLGGGQAKGGSYERYVAKTLSLWCSGGARDDLFWRTAGSGSRGTQRGAKNQLGDIGAIGAEGADFTTYCIVECKCYSRLDWSRFLFTHDGMLDGFWIDLQLQCVAHKRLPLLICKENRGPSVVIGLAGAFNLHPLLDIYRPKTRALSVVSLERFVQQSYREFVSLARVTAEDLYAPTPDERPAPNRTPRARL